MYQPMFEQLINTIFIAIATTFMLCFIGVPLAFFLKRNNKDAKKVMYLIPYSIRSLFSLLNTVPMLAVMALLLAWNQALPNAIILLGITLIPFTNDIKSLLEKKTKQIIPIINSLNPTKLQSMIKIYLPETKNEILSKVFEYLGLILGYELIIQAIYQKMLGGMILELAIQKEIGGLLMITAMVSTFLYLTKKFSKALTNN